MLAIKPGIMVAVKTSIKGVTEYDRVDLEHEVGEDHSERKVWRTERTVRDVDEAEQASKTRNRCRNLIATVCARTPWGYVCEAEREEELVERVAEARALVDAFNAQATHATLRVNTFLGRIADDDVEAARAVQEELASLMVDVEAATRAGDVKTIRDLVNRGNQVKRLLADRAEATEAVEAAFKAARAVARDVVRLVEKRGEQLDAVLAASDLSPVSHARFLLTNVVGDPVDDPAPAVSTDRFAAIADGLGLVADEQAAVLSAGVDAVFGGAS